MNFIIDVVCFRDSSNKLLIKEVAVVSLETNHMAHWMATAPYPFSDLPIDIQVHNNFLTATHLIEWFEGDIPLRHVHANLRWITRNANRVFVHGAEKTILIQNIIARHVENLEDYSCPSPRILPKINSFCWFHGIVHKEMCICALNDALRFKNWMTTNTLLMESLYTSRQTFGVCTDTCGEECLTQIGLTRHVSDKIPYEERRVIYHQNPVEYTENTGYYTGENEHSPSPGCTTTIKSTISGCFPRRSNPEEVDETDGHSS